MVLIDLHKLIALFFIIYIFLFHLQTISRCIDFTASHKNKKKTHQLRVEERFTVLCVIDLPENTSEDDLWPGFKELVPVEDILVAVDFDTRIIRDHGFILIERVYQHILLSGSEMLLGQRQLIFRENRTKVNKFCFRKMCKEAYRAPPSPTGVKISAPASLSSRAASPLT